MTDAVGPIFAAGFQQINKDGYGIVYLPDLHNAELQREGKAPVYWWLPNEVRLARRNGDAGDFKFSFIHFEGVRSGATHAGVEGTNEVTGGLLGFSTTSAPTGAALRESEAELLNRFRGSEDHYWGWRTPVAPMFRPAPIVSNTMTITNLSPNSDGSVPVPQPAGPSPQPGGGGGAPQPPGPSHAPPGTAMASSNGGGPPAIRSVMRPPPFISPRSIPLSRAYRASNLDMWYANLQGQGSGSVNPFAENAYSGLVGSIPAALIWTSFHGTTGGISVWQKLKIKVWSPAVHVLIVGSWRKIQEHYSAAGHAGGLFWSADIQAEFNFMRQSGTIETKVEVDTSIPGADKLQAELNKRTDMIFQKFMDAAQKTIFDPAPFKEEAAQASSGFLGFGGGGAFKLRRDAVTLDLRYEETTQIAYLQEYPISGQLQGLYDEIKQDPTAEKKYFTTLYLDDWERKVSRSVKPVVNWPNPSQEWVGQPVDFVSAQIGYPDTQGAIQWDGHIFKATDPPDTIWSTAAMKKDQAHVSNPPQGWTPDKTFVKRQVHFGEPPNETENPFVRVSVEKNVVDLDPGVNGSLLNDLNLEVRVDNVGGLNVGPMFLNVDLETAKQIVEVTFQAEGKTADGHDRAPVTFSWQFGDQTQPRFWMIYTGQPDYIPRFKYQVRVVVKGSIFTHGMEWIGPWVEAGANGPMLISVPAPEDQGVIRRSIAFAEVTGAGTAIGLPPARPSQTAFGLPPASRAFGTPPAMPTTASADSTSAADNPWLEVDGWSLAPPSATVQSSTSQSATAPMMSDMTGMFGSPPPSTWRTSLAANDLSYAAMDTMAGWTREPLIPRAAPPAVLSTGDRGYKSPQASRRSGGKR